jgi:anti-sigma factor RsiW
VTCREFADFMADYLSGELPADTVARFETHLSVCENCTIYLANYRKAARLGRQVFADDEAPVPDDVPEELVRAILASRRL